MARRARKGPGWIAAALVAFSLGLTLPLHAAQGPAADPARDKVLGHPLVEALINHFLGKQAHVEGFSGTPGSPRFARLEVVDAKGAWVTAEGVRIVWSPFALIRGNVVVELLHVDRLRVERLPESEASGPQPSAPSNPSSTRIQLDKLEVDRAELGAALPGGPAALALTGHASLEGFTQGSAALDIARLDAPGAYRARGSLDSARLSLVLDLDEPAGGLLAHAASLPDLGALAVHARLDGPRTAAALDAGITAGPLRATAKGTLDLEGSTADLAVQATAPAMAPRPDLRWRSAALDARVRGPFAKPEAQGTLEVDALEAAGAAVAKLRADVQGDAGEVKLRATADGVRVPGPDPLLLAGAPLQVAADTTLDDPARPVTFRVSHPLLSVQGRATTGSALAGEADVALPDLAPLARLGGAAVAGRAALHVKARQDQAADLDADGTVSLTQAPGPAVALLGPEARLGASARLAGGAFTLSRLRVDGAKLALDARGTLADGGLDATAHAALSDLAAAIPTLSGHATFDATAKGKLDDLAATLDAEGTVGTRGFAPAPVRVHARAEHLPGAPTGEVAAEGMLEGAPLALDASARRAADGTLEAAIRRAAWRSLAAEGALTLAPGATLPQGKVNLRVGSLADFRALTGQAGLAGGVEAQAELDAATARLRAKLAGVAVPGAHVGGATVEATIADPLGQHPRVQAQVAASAVEAGGVAVPSARLEASGPQEALSLRLNAEVHAQDMHIQGTAAQGPVQVQGAAVLDVPGKRVELTALTAAARGQDLRLLAPARLGFGDGVVVDRLRLGLGSAQGNATLTVAGRLNPVLDATIQAQVPGSLAGALDPAYAADGSLSLDATLRGTPARPTGTVRLDARGLRLRQGPGRAAPPLNGQVSAQLAGEAARVQGQLRAGSAQVALSGTAPLAASGPLDLRATGGLDLALLNPVIAPAGRRATGRLTLDVRATGTLAAPRLGGQVALARGELQDYAQGARLDDVAGTALLQGDEVVIPGVTARAGPGTLALSGRVGVLRPGLPVDLQVRMRDARPLASDLLTAELSGAVAARGSVAEGLAVSGAIDVLRAEIRVPERLPASVQALKVIRPGQEPPAPPAAPAAPVRLDLTVRAASAIFVRGRGLDAEMAGTLHAGGTSAAPQVSGGFNLRRGTFSLAGTTLTFTKGRVGFEGTGVSGKIDPSLDFEATSGTAQVTATLVITGTASQPKIALSSVPQLPQDEVLAYLLFRRSVKDLGPFQYAAIAAALADISGVGGVVGNPLETVRRGLGLDRLSIGTDSPLGPAGSGGARASNAAPSVEAGRYVANGVYVGAKQSTTGQGTGAQVQIDITKGLKLETDVGSGQGGNQVGVTYQYEW